MMMTNTFSIQLCSSPLPPNNTKLVFGIKLFIFFLYFMLILKMFLALLVLSAAWKIRVP